MEYLSDRIARPLQLYGDFTVPEPKLRSGLPLKPFDSSVGYTFTTTSSIAMISASDTAAEIRCLAEISYRNTPGPHRFGVSETSSLNMSLLSR